MIVFVFGSNLAGRHGRGSAAYAAAYAGAVEGIGVGYIGRSYAIPTKDERMATLPLWEIKPHVEEFLRFARKEPIKQFLVVRVGCGLAGYKNEQMAPLFRGAPENCFFSAEWARYLGPEIDEGLENGWSYK